MNIRTRSAPEKETRPEACQARGSTAVLGASELNGAGTAPKRGVWITNALGLAILYIFGGPLGHGRFRSLYWILQPLKPFPLPFPCGDPWARATSTNVSNVIFICFVFLDLFKVALLF